MGGTDLFSAMFILALEQRIAAPRGLLEAQVLSVGPVRPSYLTGKSRKQSVVQACMLVLTTSSLILSSCCAYITLKSGRDLVYPVSFKDFLRLVSCFFSGFNELSSRMECFNSVLCLYMYMLVKRETSNFSIKSLLVTNGNVFVNDFRKTERLMKGMLSLIRLLAYCRRPHIHTW